MKSFFATSMRLYQRRLKSGFTLIEMLLSVGLLAIIAGMSLPVYQSFQVRNDLDIAATTLAQSLRRAQALSQAAEGDTTSGVSLQSGSIVVFRGASYATRDATFDEVFAMPASIAITGISEVVFAKLTGLPLAAGTTTFTSLHNEVRSVTLNAKGTVSY
jgi:prepilin-type N-terminal cleavage/methylation domain-containing protein